MSALTYLDSLIQGLKASRLPIRLIELEFLRQLMLMEIEDRKVSKDSQQEVLKTS